MVEGYDISEGGGSPSESAGHLPTEMAFANEIARRIDEKLTFFLRSATHQWQRTATSPCPTMPTTLEQNTEITLSLW